MTEKNSKVTDGLSNELLKVLYARAIAYVRSKMPEQDAHDLVQECLVVLAEKHRGVQNINAFLFKIISNKLKQYYEKARRRSLVGVLLPPEEMPVSVLSTRLSIRAARHNDLQIAMQALPQRQYAAFELRYVEGLEIEEAADALGVSPATLKRDIERARKTLASVLGDETDEAELRRIARAYLRG